MFEGASGSTSRTALRAYRRTWLDPDLICLTKREKDVLGWRCNGYTNIETGKELFITEQTVKNHITNMLRKSGHGTVDGACFSFGRFTCTMEIQEAIRAELEEDLALRVGEVNKVLVWLRSRQAEYERVLDCVPFRARS